MNGVILAGGMLYVGRNLGAADGRGTEPALIDPRLHADFRQPDWAGQTVGYWPSYDDISARARAAYLTWLADGRRAPEAPVSWAFLFFYGLERRVLLDTTTERTKATALAELPVIRAEVARLLGIYGNNYSFRGYATKFLNLLDFYLTDSDAGIAPVRDGDKWQVPMTLRVGLGRFANTGAPVPADWALAWAHYHPEIYLRTPATRCSTEFETLFRARYVAKHGTGLTIRATKTLLRSDYHSASAGIGQVELSTKLPDVLTQAVPSKKLAALVDDVTSSLDAYSRYLGRNPDAAGTLAATALLPPELVAGAAAREDTELARLGAFIDTSLGAQPSVVIDAADLLTFWPTKAPGKLAKADAVALAQLLGARGAGLEPDVRLGGPVLMGGTPAVLFRITAGQPTTPSPEYAAAAVLLHLAAAVTIADGTVTDAETAHLANHLEQSMHLSHPERVRLNAHLRWLLSGQTKLTGLTKRLATLGQEQRDAIGDFLTTVAAADGHISPAEITTLQKIFKLLALDPASVYSRVHAATTGGIDSRPATGPVTVRPAAPGAPGYAIPPRPFEEPADTTAARGTGRAVTLDEAAVAAKLAETAAVSALLGSIFTDDEPATAAAAATADVPTVAGLDGPHSTLLRVLTGRASWSRSELEAECGTLGLLPDGALDTLNESAYDTVGDPVVDDAGDVLTIDPQVAQEMQA